MPKAGGGGGRGAGGGGRSARARGGGGTPKEQLEQMGIENSYLNNVSPEIAKQLVGIIPPGSVVIGGGIEAFALRLPDGTVMRIQTGGMFDRPKIPIVLQPLSTRTLTDKYGTKTTIEVMPYVKSARTMSWAEQQAGKDYITQRIPKGYYNYDLHSDNYGKDSKGRWTVFDPGGVQRFGTHPEYEKNIPRARQGGGVR